MVEIIQGFKLIRFNTGYDRYLLKGKGICDEFKSKEEALQYLEWWLSIN